MAAPTSKFTDGQPRVGRASKPCVNAVSEAIQLGCAKAPAPKEVDVEEAPATDGPAGPRTRSQNKPFQRVNVDEFMGKKGSWDMSYEATFGEGGVGWKAQAVLGQVKGDRFRHEKNKRKRSTYRGGLIDDAKVNSIKFDYSDDEK